MTTTIHALAAALVLAALGAVPASAAVSSKDCHAKFDAAKKAGTLGNKTYADFKKSDCAAAAASSSSATTAGASSATKPAASSAAAPKPVANGPVFPTAIKAAYASEPVSKGRLHTCVDQYRANKATNSNGDLKWIQKGGGYWSQCDHKLGGGTPQSKT